MKRVVGRLCRITGAAMLLGLSAAAAAQSTSCTATTCSYGPICPDAWGGCYFYTWSIASAKNDWKEIKGGLSNVVKLCEANNPDSCVKLTSSVQTDVTEGGANQFIRCQVAGADTCTDEQCGGSPGSSGAVFLSSLSFQSLTSTVDASSCTRDKDVVCSKSNTLEGLKGDANAAAQFCPNKNWTITQWWPLNFTATTTVTGPQSKQNPTPVSTVAKLKCWLKDPKGNFPYQEGYALSSNLADNQLECREL